MANRTLSNPERGCGHLKRGKGYIRGVIGSPDGVLPSFVKADPPIPFREMGTDGGFTRGFLTLDGVTAQANVERTGSYPDADDDGLADFVPLYPGDATDAMACENMADKGLYPTAADVPDAEVRRHLDRVLATPCLGDHWGEVDATSQSDLLMRAGKTHYPDPSDFVDEAREMGISKAIPLSKRQEPPTVVPGATRCWIVHPDTDQGWAVIGYAYLQEVVFTEPADGHVPDYVQDWADTGRLDVVDIEDAPDDDGDDDTNAGTSLSDFDGGQDDDDADGADDAAGDTEGETSDAPDADQDSDADADSDVSADADAGGTKVVPAEGDSGDPDVQQADQAMLSADDLSFNDLRSAASQTDVDLDDPRPDAETLAGALADAGLTPNDLRGMAGGDGDE